MSKCNRLVQLSLRKGGRRAVTVDLLRGRLVGTDKKSSEQQELLFFLGLSIRSGGNLEGALSQY